MFEVANIGEDDAREHVTIETVKEDVVRAIKTIVTLVHTLDAAPTEVSGCWSVSSFEFLKNSNIKDT